MYHSLNLICRQSDREQIEANLFELGTQGITERDLPGELCELEAFFPEPFEDLRAFSKFSPRWRTHSEEPWADPFSPFLTGQRLYIIPAWQTEHPTPPGRLRLEVHARQASGSGYQPATQLALEAIDRHLRPGDRFLDVGTGSGILSAAAELLGAGPRFACDIDLEALTEARENGVPANLFAGSARAIASNSVDLVAANLNAEALLSLQPDLLRVLKPKGRLILSGFTARNVVRLSKAFQTEVIDTLESEDWRTLVLTKRNAPQQRQTV